MPQSPPGCGIELTGGCGTTWHDDFFCFCSLCDPSALLNSHLIPPPFFFPSLFMLKKKTRLSLSQSFLFANISKVNGCGACGFSQPSSCLLRQQREQLSPLCLVAWPGFLVLVRGSLGSKSIKKPTNKQKSAENNKKKRLLPSCFLVLFLPYLVSCSSVSWEMSLWSPGLLVEQISPGGWSCLCVAGCLWFCGPHHMLVGTCCHHSVPGLCLERLLGP